jgi:predicted DNA-binding WGR domain protein
MADWKVHLGFSEGSSNKFWRAKVDGNNLLVNYGRIGSDGQTQVKAFASAAAALAELEKLEREKRKKGYDDLGAGGDSEDAEAPDEDEEEEEEEEEEEAAPPPKAKKPAGAAALTSRIAATATKIEHADFRLEADGIVYDLRLSLDGAQVRTTVVERYKAADAAAEAFKRLKEQMLADGYQKVPARDGL